MAEDVAASGDAAELALSPEQQAYFERHAGTPEQEKEAPETQAPVAPAPEPTEAEAEETEAPSAEAPSQTEEPDSTPAAPSASEADWKRWFGLAAKSLETGRPQWSQIPKGLRDEVAAALDSELGGTDAATALREWSGEVEFTPAEVAERERAAAEQARAEAQQQAQVDAYNAQVWAHFERYDPDLHPEFQGDRFDLIEAADQSPDAYEAYKALKRQYALQNDPQAQVEAIATQRAVEAQRGVVQNLLGQFLSQDFISTVPSVRARLEQAQKGGGDFLESQGYEKSAEGYVQFVIGVLKEASEYHGTVRGAKKVMEKTHDIQAAAERAARAQFRNTLPKDTAGTGSAPAYMPPSGALQGGSELAKWIASSPKEYEAWKAAGRPGYQGQGWQGRQGAWSQRQ